MAVTRPRGTMLRNRSVFDLEIAPTADIALTKLNRGGDIVLRDASGAKLGSVNMDGKGVYNAADAVDLTDLVTLRQVQNYMAAAGIAAEWQESVLSRLSAPPASPVDGERYLILPGATSAWAGKDNQVAEFDGTQWVYTVCTVGTYVSVDDVADGIFYFGGTNWVKKNYETLVFNKGLYKDDATNTVSLDTSVAGDGIGITAQGILNVTAGDGITVTADGVEAKLDGATLAKSVDGLKVNFAEGLQTNGEGKLAINLDASGGIVLNGSTGGLEVNDGNGLELTGNKLQVKAKDSSILSEVDGVSVNLGNGLGLDGVSGKVTLVIDPTSTGGISLSATGLKLTIPVDVMTEGRYVVREPASGAVDGTNATFYVAREPVAGTEQVFLEGSLMSPGDDYNFDYANSRFVFVAEQIPQVFEGTPDKVLVTYLAKN